MASATEIRNLFTSAVTEEIMNGGGEKVILLNGDYSLLEAYHSYVHYVMNEQITTSIHSMVYPSTARLVKQQSEKLDEIIEKYNL